MISERYRQLTADDIEAILRLMEAKLKRETTGLMVRLPADIKSFLAAQSERNSSSQNSEIIRAVRERMERVKREEIPAQAGN